MSLIHEQDELPDKVEDIAVLLTLKRISMPDEIKEEFSTFLERILDTVNQAFEIFKEMDNVFETTFSKKEIEKIHSLIDELEEKEWKVDKKACKIAKIILSLENKLSPVEIFLWMNIIKELSTIIFNIIRKFIFETKNLILSAKRIGPFLSSFVFFIITLSIIYKGLRIKVPLFQSMIISISFSCAIYSLMKSGNTKEFLIPMWILFFGSFSLALGTALFGYKVIKTLGEEVTEITPTRGFSAEFGAATTILIFSKLGLPISTTHTIIGAVIGVGIARGISGLNLGVIKNIILSWILTVPFSAILTGITFTILKFII